MRKVRIKTWEEMKKFCVERTVFSHELRCNVQYLRYGDSGSLSVWNSGLESSMPEDRIIDMDSAAWNNKNIHPAAIAEEITEEETNQNRRPGMMRKVKIKTWKEMEKEFGLSTGGIDCKCGFTMEMEFFMPSDRIIEICNYRWRVGKCFYDISDDMIAEELEEPCQQCGPYDFKWHSTKNPLYYGKLTPENLTKIKPLPVTDVKPEPVHIEPEILLHIWKGSIKPVPPIHRWRPVEKLEQVYTIDSIAYDTILVEGLDGRRNVAFGNLNDGLKED